MKMHNPPHPGKVLKDLYLDPLELSVTEAAKALVVNRNMLSEIINGKASVTPDIALRFQKAFGGSASSWLKNQQKYDFWQAEQTSNVSKVKVLHRPFKGK